MDFEKLEKLAKVSPEVRLLLTAYRELEEKHKRREDMLRDFQVLIDKYQLYGLPSAGFGTCAEMWTYRLVINNCETFHWTAEDVRKEIGKAHPFAVYEVFDVDGKTVPEFVPL